MLDYCWQCGVKLTDATDGGQFYQGAARTQNFNQPNYGQGFNNYQNNYVPNYQLRPASYSFGRVAAVLGGIFLFVLMVAGAGAAVVYKVATKPRVNPYPEYRYRNPEPVKPAPVKENPVTDNKKSSEPRAEFEKIWVEYNVRENGRLGMRIHVKFSVFNMKGVDSQVVVYFEKPDGTKLTTTDKKFASKDGKVSVSRALKPGWDETVYKDLEVFMPYDELNLGRGKYNLKMDVDLTKDNGDLIEHLGYHDFIYEKS